MDKFAISSEIIRKISAVETINMETLLQRCKEGSVLILTSKKRSVKPVGIGFGLRVKINANLGASPGKVQLKREMHKLNLAVENGSDTIMDLSIDGDIDHFRRTILKESQVPVGSCPVYQVFADASKRKKSIASVDKKHFFEIIEKQASDGISFMGLHCALTLKGLEETEKVKRVTGIVSRGGGLMACWMKLNKQENPLYENFDQVLKIFKKYGVVLDISDCLRPGCLADANNKMHLSEMKIAGELVKYARNYGVSVMVEGPGHMPLDQIEASIKLQKQVCDNAPLYMLGPLVTDVGLGYDHIVAAIGGALAGWYGADFLCDVTPSEHLGLPTANDLIQGIVATRLAGHIADIAKGNLNAWNQDLNLSKLRKELKWSEQPAVAITSSNINCMLEKRPSGKSCNMCGKYCPMKLTVAL